MYRKVKALSFLLFLMTSALFPCLTFAQNRTVVNIGIVRDGPSQLVDNVQERFESEILVLLEKEFEVQFKPENILISDYSMESIHAANDELLNNPSVDVIIALGMLASQDMGLRAKLAKPVIAPLIIDKIRQGVGVNAPGGQLNNLNYIQPPQAVDRELLLFNEIVPFKKLAFLVNKESLEVLPALGEKLFSAQKSGGFELVVLPVAASADQTLAALPDGTDAIFMTPLMQLSETEFAKLMAGLNAQRLPTFSYLGYYDVERGVLAGLASDSWIPNLSRRVALNLQSIMLGSVPADLPGTVSRREELVLNMSTARKIGFSPSFPVLTEARLIQQTRTEVSRTTSINNVIREALQANPGFLADQAQLASDFYDKNKARARLLPQLSISGQGSLIDADRAESILSSAERSFSGGVSLQQVLWSESGWANLSIQKHLHAAREHSLQSKKLDLIVEVSSSYLNLLRAKTREQILKDNLRLSRSNLERAQVREAIGVSNQAEIYRWQSKIAGEKRQSINANSARNLAEIDVNRILNRPLEEAFLTEEINLNDASLAGTDTRFERFVGNPNSFRIFRAFLVEQGLKNSPEIAALDQQIAATARRHGSAKHSFLSPTLILQGDLTRQFSRSGAGSQPLDPSTLSPEVAPIMSAFGSPDKTNWGVSLGLSFPIFSGGERIAELHQSNKILATLGQERKALTDRLEQRIRSAAHMLGASRAGIDLARESATNAQLGLELVADAYTRGLANIIELLDAQHASFAAELDVADSIYGFMLDLVELERAVGITSVFCTELDHSSWLDELEVYFQKNNSSN